MEENKSYEVLARKWRPQQFEKVVGQEHVTRTLQNAIKLNRVAHAYLFVGPRGIGKTSIARIFAKALNCKEGPTEKPCDQCESCRGIVAGNSFDVREIDGASNRQIDDVRALREDVKYMPNGRYKIYIIDEVHALTPDAFNALLKTLEEPPPQVVFLFATTEPQKVPLTILSRCQRFDLRRIPLRLIIERLALIAREENIEIEPDALLAVARAAEGGLRDAESALDQLIAFQGNKISEENVISVFGLMPRQALEDLALAIFKGDITGLVRSVELMDREGKDMNRLLLELLEHCRNLLIYHAVGLASLEIGTAGAEMDLTENQVETLKNQITLVDPERLLCIIDILTETINRLRFALSKKTLLEVALLRCARAATTVSLDRIIAEVKQLSAVLADGTGNRPVHSVSLEDKNQAESRLADKKKDTVDPAAEEPGQKPDDELSLLVNNWHTIVERTGNVATLARANLVDSVPIEVGPVKVTIAFEPEFAERIEQAGMPRNRAALQKTLSDFLRRPVSVDFTVSKGQQPEKNTNSEPAPEPEQPADGGGKKNVSGLHSRHKWLENESVRKTLDLFEGKIVDIRE
jgi:DNA polymerase-3 subunit gamma/tau